MKSFNLYKPMLGISVVVAIALSGCNQHANQEHSPSGIAASHEDHDHEGPDAEPVHGGWWCYEHAVPEEQCAMCDAKLAAQLREKGDWCEEHMRPDSLCFKCHPENAEKFVALFEAKYGKKPPAATD